MKHLGSLIMLGFLPFLGFAQNEKNLKLGGGYFGQNLTSPGLVLEFEYETYLSDLFSSSTRADIMFFVNEDYWSLGIDLHQGYRKYLSSGLFFEQSMGLGIIHSTFNIDHFTYVDAYGNGLNPSSGLNLGFMPSATIGVGYDLTHKKETQNLIWLRPKAYWNFLYRDFSEPFFAIQLGYTYTLKNIKK